MSTPTTTTTVQLFESIKNQARRAVYDERDDSVFFERSKIESEEVRRRILVERAIVRMAVRSILLAAPWGYTVSVWDGEEYALKRSRDLNAIMDEIGACDEEVLVVRRADGEEAGARVGSLFLVYGNDGWDVICDHTDSPLMHELLAEATRLSDELCDLQVAEQLRRAA